MHPADTNAPLSQQGSAHQAAGRPSNSNVNPVPTSLPPGLQHRSEDSWIEVSSQPSSSSLSSANDEIITEGLRVQHDSNLRRRRRLRPGASMKPAYNSNSAGASSQEEYDESESESDRVMMSSNEIPRPSPLQFELRHYEHAGHSTTSSEEMSAGEDDDDENSTAVNRPRGSNNTVFRPQPNAFSHPSSSQPPRLQRTGSYSGARPHVRPNSQRHSYPSQQRHSPYNMVSPTHQADHDAVLRASLSTLLSLGAAARGLPKSGQQSNNTSTTPSSRIEPASLRMVPESVAFGDSQEPSEPLSSIPSRPVSATSDEVLLPSDKIKRKVSATPRSRSRERQLAKKAKRTATMENISPTMFTWAVSAGIIVLFSAVSFSAGYMVGKESGRAEVIGQLGGGASESGSCAREAASEIGRTGMGLKKLRWSGVTGAAAGVRV